MCLWNTYASSGNKVKIWQKSLSPKFWHRPTPQGHVMSVKCEQPLDELTVKVLLLYDNPNFKYCTLNVSRTELRTGGQTDDSNTRCPRGTSQAIFSAKVKVKVTRSLTMVSFERASIVEYACQIWSLYLLCFFFGGGIDLFGYTMSIKYTNKTESCYHREYSYVALTRYKLI